MPTVFGNQQTEYVNIIKEMLMASLTYQTSYDVRFCAVKGKEKYNSYNFHCIYIVNEIYILNRPKSRSKNRPKQRPKYSPKTPQILLKKRPPKRPQRLAHSSHTKQWYTRGRNFLSKTKVFSLRPSVSAAEIKG